MTKQKARVKKRNSVAYDMLTSGKYRAKVVPNRKKDSKNQHKED